MRKEFQDKLKKKLIAQRNEILDTLAGKNEQLSRLVAGSETGDDVDIASDTIDRQLLNSLGMADQNRLTAINNALDRIERGTFGVCPSCGKNIPEARLEAIPYAVMCIDCQEKAERSAR
ncbi:MAG: TraR/DksA family transcriptional regulator [Treponema sp.]|nr:TraR/DksA family transcriptional regulator [Treponema sp.]